MTKTIKMQVTAHDLRSTFGNVVDYVMTELSSMVEGWEIYDTVSRNYVNGVIFWEFHLQMQNGDVIATVFIKEYPFDDDTDDDTIVAEAEVEVEK